MKLEQLSAWITVIIGIIIPFVGWIFNTLITNKINDLDDRMNALEQKNTQEKALFFKRLDDMKDSADKNFVRKDLYEQAMKFHAEHTDEKFRSMLAIMTTNFESVEQKIDELKKVINEKLNHHT